MPSDGYLYDVTITRGDFEHTYLVVVPDGFDRVRGADDCARDLAAKRFAGDAYAWRCTGDEREIGVVYVAPGYSGLTTNLARDYDAVMMVVEERRSPSGCHRRSDDGAHPVTMYVVIKVGDRAFNAKRARDREWATLGGALGKVATLAGDDSWQHWRVVELPAGEPWDYDGMVVADLQIGRGVA